MRSEDRDDHDGVGHLHERPAVGVGAHRAVSAESEGVGEHDVERELIGEHDEQRPAAETADRAHGLVSHVEANADSPQVTAQQRGHETEELHRDARGGAQPEPEEIARPVERTKDGGGVDEMKPDEDGDADDVVGDRDPRRNAKAPANVEQRRRDADDAVEEDLGNEEAQQVGGDGALLGDDGE